MADVLVNAPGLSADQVEQLVATPLEKILYQIDGVEYVYSMARENQAIITVRFYVGQDRERSLVKLFKKLDEHQDIVPPGVTGWVVKPVEIDDVPVVTLALASATDDSHSLRRVGEEVVQRLAALPNVSRAYVVGGEPRTVRVDLDPERLQAYSMSPLEVQQALVGANIVLPAGSFTRNDSLFRVKAGMVIDRPEQLSDLVVGVFQNRPVFLKDIATVRDGPAEVSTYVRHGWGPARGFEAEPGSTGTLIGPESRSGSQTTGAAASHPAVTIAIAKQKGTNAVAVAKTVLKAAEDLRREVVPGDVDMVITRNSGLTADDKVNELVEALWVAILIVVALLTLSLGWREAFIVAVAVPVVFGLTLGVNLLFGYTINRVTLFALILSLGLLVDDPIVDVENIARHFAMRGKATRAIVLEAVAEIRPPLISATLAVIVSFLPMFFITGMMGPYMAPMALNVPVAMLMSMVVAFTITPWMAYQVLHRKFNSGGGSGHGGHDPDDPDAIRQTRLYKIFYPLMKPLLHSRLTAAALLARDRDPDRRRDGPGGNESRSAQDAAVRQQERVAACSRLRRGNDARAVERGCAGDRVRAGQSARGDQFHQLRRGLQPDRLQRPGAPLLPQADAAPGGDPDQSCRQEATRGPESCPGTAASRPAHADRREAQGAAQDRRAATRPPRSVVGCGRSLRPGRPVLLRADLCGRHGRRPLEQGTWRDRGR